MSSIVFIVICTLLGGLAFLCGIYKYSWKMIYPQRQERPDRKKKKYPLLERRKEINETILEKLIQMVDDPAYGWKPLSGWKKLKRNILNVTWLSISLFYLGVLLYAVYLLLPMTETKVLLSTLITLTALILQSGIVIKVFTKPEEREETRNTTTEWNYQRIKDKVDDEHHLLLKALIRMKTLQPDFRLSEVQKKTPYLFSEENLIGMLYDSSLVILRKASEKMREVEDAKKNIAEPKE